MANEDDQNLSEEYRPRRRSTFTPPEVEELPTENDNPDMQDVDHPNGAEYQPPSRQSLTQTELETRLNSGLSQDEQTISLIELVEQQMTLRQADTVAFRQWEREQLAIGTTESFAALHKARNLNRDLATVNLDIPETPEAQISGLNTVDLVTDKVEITITPESSDGPENVENLVTAEEVELASVDEKPLEVEEDSLIQPDDEAEFDEYGPESFIAGQRGFVSDVVAEALAELAEEDSDVSNDDISNNDASDNDASDNDASALALEAVEAKESYEESDPQLLADLETETGAAVSFFENETRAETESEIEAEAPADPFALTDVDLIDEADPVEEADQISATEPESPFDLNEELAVETQPDESEGSTIETLIEPSYQRYDLDELSFDDLLTTSQSAPSESEELSIIENDETADLSEGEEENAVSFPKFLPVGDGLDDPLTQDFPPVVPVLEAPAIATEIQPKIEASTTTIQPVVHEVQPIKSMKKDSRTGAFFMFLLFLSLGASLVVFSLAGQFITGGLSLRQSFIALIIGGLLSAVTLVVGIIMAQRSGESALISSRSAFGIFGNIPVAVITLVFKIIWSVALVLLSGWLFAQSLIASGWLALDSAFLSIGALVLSIIIVGTLLSLKRQHMIFGVVGLGMIAVIAAVIVIVLSWNQLDIASALEITDGSWFMIFTGGSVIFLVFGLNWIHSGADLLKLGKTESSRGVWLLGLAGALLSLLILLGYGILLGSSDMTVAQSLLDSPARTLIEIMPGWAGVFVILALVPGILIFATVTAFSAKQTLPAIGVRLPRLAKVAIIWLLIAVAVFALYYFNSEYYRLDLTVGILLLSVPVAAWAGIITSETLLRRQAIDRSSLRSAQGVYGTVNWLSLTLWILSTIVGLGFMHPYGVSVFDSWVGYGWNFFGDLPTEFVTSFIGIPLAFVLALVLTMVTSWSIMRKQDRAAAELSAQSSWLE